MTIADTSPDTTLDHALAYIGASIRVIPIARGHKYPKGMSAWQDQATTDTDTVVQWWDAVHPGHGIGLAMGPQPDGRNLIALDVDEHDPNQSGSDTLAELESAHGELPETVRSITGGGGTHIILEAPADVDIHNHQGAKPRLGPGIDVRGRGGQIVVSPSFHPDTGARYEWEADHAPWEHPIAEAPDWVIEMLRPRPAQRPARRRADAGDGSDSIAAHVNETHDWHDELDAAGWTLHHTDRATGDSHWTRPGKDSRQGSSAVLHEPDGPLVVFSTGAEVEEGAYSMFGYLAERDHHGDRSALAREARLEANATGSANSDTEVLMTDADTDDPPGPPEDWPEPTPLGMASGAPPFPLEAFPAWIADYARAVASNQQTALDLPAQLAITTLSVALNTQYEIDVRRWVEPVNIYTVTALPPSAGKSPVFKRMCGVIDETEHELVEATANERRVRQSKRKAIEADLKRCETAGDETEALHHLDELDNHPEIPEPRLVADDVTVEALVDLLREQSGRLGMLSSEGGLFDAMAGRYSDKANLDPYLQAWSGETIRIDRIGRGHTIAKKPHLVIGLTVQPVVIQRLAEKPELRGRGLTARFMYAVPADFVGRRNLVDAPEVASSLAHTYNARIKALLTAEVPTSPTTMRMSAECARRFHEWRQELEDRRRPDGDLRPMAEWTAKLESSVARLTALLHIAEGADPGAEISTDTLERALLVGWYWLEHSKVVHDMWGTDDTTSAAKTILAWLSDHRISEFSASEAQQARRSHFPTVRDVVEPLELLTERGWVWPLFDGPLTVGRRGVESPRFAVHPSLADGTQLMSLMELNQEGNNRTVQSDESHQHRYFSEVSLSISAEEGECQDPSDATDETQPDTRSAPTAQPDHDRQRDPF